MSVEPAQAFLSVANVTNETYSITRELTVPAQRHALACHYQIHSPCQLAQVHLHWASQGLGEGGGRAIQRQEHFWLGEGRTGRQSGLSGDSGGILCSMLTPAPGPGSI